jgi:RNA polymerase subunit RPABC4/transcription elongation factor Spt4
MIFKRFKRRWVFFILIGGLQPKKVKVDDRARTCPQCQTPTARLVRLDNYLSLFFIPVVPIKKGLVVLTCDRCGGVWDEADPNARPEPKRIGPVCPACQQVVEPQHRFCPSCGRKL